MSAPGLPQGGAQGETIAPISYPTITLSIRESMVCGSAPQRGYHHNRGIGSEPIQDLWQVVLTCFEKANNWQAIYALTGIEGPNDPLYRSCTTAGVGCDWNQLTAKAKGAHTPARNSKMPENRPAQPRSGRSDSSPAPWMPGDWDRR